MCNIIYNSEIEIEYSYCPEKLNLPLIILLSLGDDWEHEEIFTDDDEAVGIDPDEREDLAPEIPAPPEIKQVIISVLLPL